ncbi:hypothetical protein HRI_002107800 [Hibiscus trionum]|uniref:Bifunctional inhibitor/plant lipid transfer protein/seed storage helical domain-containing protein n=1 Tax=Hibiscus trionum TaxID=183268 RepID=A0A9W7HYQ6_HIBTR|nr:hypothetical protein HRI_002107800 [Hibiscus trionum]
MLLKEERREEKGYSQVTSFFPGSLQKFNYYSSLPLNQFPAQQPHKFALKKPTSGSRVKAPVSLLSISSVTWRAAMASTKTCALFMVFSLLLHSSFTSACNSCKPPKPIPPPACPPPGSCPKDTLKLGVCADLLGLVNIVVGTPPSSKCCALLQGLADLEAALCLCTAIKANVLGINLNVPVTLSLLLSACQKEIPAGFKC